MATTTNFGWETPDDTDLVKDGALAIRTLGSAIDTSLVDLKGGTTGQVLSKTSNTDMDFTWVTSDDANAIQNAIVDAKGDLIAASAADTPARLAVGNNGETLVADSSTSTGLRYIPATVMANPIINGGMDIWQRGTTSGTVTTAKTFLADRFYSATGNGALSYTASRSTDKPDGFQYSMKIQRTAGNTTSSEIYFWHDLETVNSIPFAGKTVTVSFYAKRGANFSAGSNALGMAFRSGTGTDQTQYYASYTGQADVVTGAATLTTSWQRFSFTGTVATSATELGFNVYYTATGTAGADDSFFITGVQVDVGNVALPFRRSGGTLAGELAAARRYYYRLTGPSASSSPVFSTSGISWSATNAAIFIQNPVSMRTTASSVEFSTLKITDQSAYNLTVTALTIDAQGSNQDFTSLNATNNTGATTNRPAWLAGSSNAGYVGLSAEL